MIQNKTFRIVKNKFLDNLNLTGKADKHKHKEVITNYVVLYICLIKKRAEGLVLSHHLWLPEVSGQCRPVRIAGSLLPGKALSASGLPNWVRMYISTQFEFSSFTSLVKPFISS